VASHRGDVRLRPPSAWRANFALNTGILVTSGVCVALALFGTLTVSLDDRFVHVAFGFGVFRRRFPLADIRSWTRVKNPWWWGYGIRYYFGGTLYNAAGPLAVELTLNPHGTRVRIGTNDLEGLAAALDQGVGSRPPLTAGDVVAVRRQARRARFRILGVAVAILIATAVVFSVHLKAPSVVLSEQSVSVRSGWYSADIPFREIASASLENELPRIELRTNGFAAGGTLRGNFRLTGLGTGQLFVNRRSPPFVVIRRAQDARANDGVARVVAVNFEDPAETRRLYERLIAASPRLRTGR
jgi:hypothetical protein